MNTCSIPVQLGPDYSCFTCGAPATGGHYWLPCNSPLDAYSQHIYYLRAPCACCHRVARLGDASTALEFVRLPNFQAQIAANVDAIEKALDQLRQPPPKIPRVEMAWLNGSTVED
jgi:hypothetical protein